MTTTAERTRHKRQAAHPLRQHYIRTRRRIRTLYMVAYLILAAFAMLLLAAVALAVENAR